MLEDPNKLTETITLRFTKAQAEMLKAGAAKAGFTGVRSFAREIVLESLAVPSEKTLLLETMLQVDYRVAEYLRVLAGESLDERSIERIRARSEAIVSTLLARFVMKRGTPETINGQH